MIVPGPWLPPESPLPPGACVPPPVFGVDVAVA
jgi:hypothetical protein